LKRIANHILFAAVLNSAFLTYWLYSSDFAQPEDLCEVVKSSLSYDLFGSGGAGCFINPAIATFYFVSGTFVLVICIAPIIEVLRMFIDDYREWLHDHQG
jgi:hypothetical protein